MDKLIKIETGLIPVYENEQRDPVVNARELHEFLNVGRDFSTWIKNKLSKYGFIENQDYFSFTETGEREIGATRKIEYILTMDTAKELSMVENNVRGSQIRRYFISIEKRYKQSIDVSKLPPELQMFKQLFDSVAKTHLQIEKVNNQVQEIREVIAINPGQDWRSKTNKLMQKIGYKLSDYEAPKTEVYKALEKRAGCLLERRLDNLMTRALRNGMTPSKVKQLNYLDVIADDRKLIEIYTSIVKEKAIKHGVA
jgi:anti-repressor protein